MRQKNIIAAIVLIAFAIVYGGLTANLPLRTLPNTPDPSLFPWINTVIILVLSLLLLITGLKQQAMEPANDNGAQRGKAPWALAALVVYVTIMPSLGFVLATVPFFAALMVLYGERRPIAVAAGSICAAAALYILFRHGFGVFLPRGLLAEVIT